MCVQAKSKDVLSPTNANPLEKRSFAILPLLLLLLLLLLLILNIVIYIYIGLEMEDDNVNCTLIHILQRYIN